ncbi:translation initiation factor IF-2 [Sediminispirochaeta smaragdinae]|jgi:translation initiation factor IF-2|uniref:Translation initiation factor IF-2 n=1 Tax=Sediminispirochaeta smaragdinae (strain DSM 11293 / JCM 15392 / SEBR 4228) TaxID=573413 RepID=E1R1K9_SEDSS|nr:translation initiation factor IF-2 [Sediminispirochaeta smaragdinae]ADK81150.1 translation initiation factor IF-2 [Sediminispirochaeta smaragdinae DSM 11293]
MAEEQDKKQKPKATLIKHRKPSAGSFSQEDRTDKNDKKKVVVVKKKTKKTVPKVVAKKEEPVPVEQEKQAVSSPQAPRTADSGRGTGTEARPPQRPRQNTHSQTNSRPNGPQDRRPYNRDSRDNNRDNRDNRGFQNRNSHREGGSDQRRSFDRRQSGPDASQQRRSGGPAPRRQGGAPSGGPRRGPSGPPPRGPRRGPGTAPQGGQRRGPGSAPAGGKSTDDSLSAGKKQGGKKFYKAKKKTAYQKSKKDDVQEKSFQIKKKQVKRANPVPKEIEIMEVITVSELARKMNLKASELIGKLMEMGMMVTINQQIDAETAEILASEYNCNVKIVSLYDETLIETEKDNDEDLRERPPIVTVMGHVDHGKTKLLDAIRSTNVVAGEFGGITQHIGAYKVKVRDHEVVFLDTPGHEAFTLMRARGAQITDIVILVVAANDGVMPQTIEAIHHAKEAKVPIIVAVNKVDLADANIDRVKQQLSEYDLIPEAWGGSTLFCEISALKKTGIDSLLETVLLQAELLELKANYTCRAEGKVIESKVDHGRGIVSTVIVQRGTLRVGDAFVAGVYPGKVRALFNDKGEKIDEAPPATPVEILGFTGIPDAGSPFQVTETERQARQVGAKRQELEKQGEAQNVKKITLDNLYDSIQEGSIQELKVVVKGDVHGSVEALQTALEKLSTKEIHLVVIHAAAGAIVENDVNLAAASNAIIVGFHVRPTPKAQMIAEREKVDIRKYNVIYDAVEDIRSAMEGMLAPDLQEEVIGTVEVRDTFKVPKIGVIAGCYVTNGKARRNALVRVYREHIEIHSGKISSLKRFKDDAKEVDAGYECGLGIENFNDLKVGDTLEVYEVREIAKKL